MALTRHILRDLNIPPEVSLPIVGGVQYIDLSGYDTIEQVNVLTALKAAGVKFTSPPAEPPTVITAPTLTLLVPASATHNTSITLQVQGTNFVNGSKINFGANAEKTTFVSATSLTCTLAKRDLALKGLYPVTVNNPDGQTSNMLAFTCL